MKSQFITNLHAELVKGDKIWELRAPLVYKSALLRAIIAIPAGFQTDLASVPRLPIIYTLWGNRAHHEAVIHDYLYRIDSTPVASFDDANRVFLEAMKVRGKNWFVRGVMYAGVCFGGRRSYHKKKTEDKLT